MSQTHNSENLEEDKRKEKFVRMLQALAEKYRDLYCSVRATSNSDYERLKRQHRLPFED